MASTRRISVSYTVLILGGFALVVAGAVLAVLGVGGAIEFEGELGDVKVSTTSLGLAIMVIGAAIALITAIKKPSDVVVFGGSSSTDSVDRLLQRVRLPLLIVVAVGIILLIISLFS